VGKAPSSVAPRQAETRPRAESLKASLEGQLADVSQKSRLVTNLPIESAVTSAWRRAGAQGGGNRFAEPSDLQARSTVWTGAEFHGASSNSSQVLPLKRILRNCLIGS
jgi:hypothetical protein